MTCSGGPSRLVDCSLPLQYSDNRNSNASGAAVVYFMMAPFVRLEAVTRNNRLEMVARYETPLQSQAVGSSTSMNFPILVSA